MITLEGYTIIEQIHRGQKTLLYRARRTADALPVVIKVLTSARATPTDIARFKHEYRLISALECPGVIRTHDLLFQGGDIILVLEDMAGYSLDRTCRGSRIPVDRFLHMAVQLAETLGYIHQKGVVHRDIKPANILLNPDTGAVKLSDFGIARELSHDKEKIYNPEVIEGTLLYMSPEQTGRMNRFVDHRTDFYSLGITFYEMLTGAPPFRSTDPLEIIHSHIARRPVPPAEIAASIPAVLSDIVMKLLSKTAEERYQNGYGLLNDLDECLRQWQADGTITPFRLAESDVALKFIIPQQLCGREDEVRRLMDAFDRVGGGRSSLLLVTGQPGIGKSAIINEIHKPVLARRGLFLAGKYDQFRRDVPYSAIIQAFQGIITQILAQDVERITAWKRALSGALGSLGRIITDVIPRLELLVGSQPDVPVLGPEESQNRFNLVFKKFIGAFAGRDHPLVLFLDDLQWSDAASLRLLAEVMTDPEIRHLLLIGAYRDSEVEHSHLLTRTLDDLAASGIHPETISLGPLSQDAVNQMVVNFLHCSPDDARELAVIISGKTGGNPFFFNQFMKTLYDEHLITYAPRSGTDRGGWMWDTATIAGMQVTDNVVELLAGKITRLSPGSVELMKIGAVIGNRFDLTILSSIAGRSIDDTLADLTQAIEEGLVNFEAGLYRFHHDRIQQAAYSLINAAERGAMHHRIGRTIRAETPAEELPGKLLFIVDHLNLGSGKLSESRERVELAELNLQAASKARSSAAYESALAYLQSGIDLLALPPLGDRGVPAAAWEQHYELTLALHRDAAEAAYLCTRYDAMERHAETVMRRARTILDRSDVFSVRISTMIAQGRLVDAIDTGVEALRMLGIKLPARPTKLNAAIALVRAKLALAGKSHDDIINLPAMEDPLFLAAFRIIGSMVTAAYFAAPNMIPVLVVKIMTTSLRHGNAPESVMAYAGYGLVLSIIGQVDEAIRFGDTAMTLLERMNLKKGSTAPLLIINTMLRTWHEPLLNIKQLLDHTYRNGLEVGEFEMAANILLPYVYLCFVSNANLFDLEQETARLMQTITVLKQTKSLGFMKLIRQAMLNLTGRGQHAILLTGQSFNEEEMLPGLMATRDKQLIATFHFLKFQLSYLFHDYRQAFEHARLAGKDMEVLAGVYQYYIYFFWEALIRIALYESGGKKHRSLLRHVRRNIRKMKRWAGQAPQQYRNKYFLLEAEYARLRGRDRRAMEFFDRAIAESRKNHFLSDRALAHELAAKFWLDRGREKIAGLYMVNAYNDYREWGAGRKAEDLRKRYPELLAGVEAAPASDGDSTTINASLTIDMSSAIKASQAIAGEIELDRLVEKMLAILIENAGAENGHLILSADGDLTVAARGTIGGIEMLPAVPVTQCGEISPAIVNFVARTGENVIIPDARDDNIFSSDEYIRANRPRSVMCIPITNQGRLSAVLYLENNQTVNAFSPDRVRLLEMLSSQAALSIENARLLVHREHAARLSTEIEIAAGIQSALLPEAPSIPGFDVTAYIRPADNMGGDYYDVINAGGRHWVIIGDVSGHGVPAGLIMMMVQTSIQTVVRRYPEIAPSELLGMVNQAIRYNVGRMKDQKYMTITAFSFTPDGRAKYSGLHLDLLLYRAATGAVEKVPSVGIWLSPWDIGQENSDAELSMERGDVLFLYTDGISEARKADDEMFTDRRLMEILKRTGGSETREVMNVVLDELSGFTTRDDVTMVLLKKE